MSRLFVDSVFYIALLAPEDQHRERARSVADGTEGDALFTSDAVLSEVLTFFGGRGSYLRGVALAFVDRLLDHAETRVVRQTPALFDEALNLYRARPDKAYSLTDCMSMVICRRERIDAVLTHDRHFAQEGLEILL